MEILEVPGKKSRKYITWEIDENNCWVCTSHYPVRGYPKIKFDGKKIALSHYMYERFVGKIPEGKQINHKCDNRQCINPEHLEAGTQSENIQQMWDRGRGKNRFTK